MAKIVDARTSQNASFAGSIAVPITVINTPQLVGQIGLNTMPGMKNPRVQMIASVSLTLPLALAGITITIVRGTLPTDPLVFSATQTFDLSVLAPQVVTVAASDYLPPDAPQLVYTMFVASNILGTIRVGPESLNGTLLSD
ncbi:hypothetical protein [Gorillibacterium sp. sgz5001074]|uniref:hypothetical protein n=1 Tax=Gorillibacterium sp. sgz5001074 TaxID=3446695 RepID=UPI003F67B796